MRAIVLAGLVVLSGCDWELAQTTALCTRSGTCDGGVDAGTGDAGDLDAGSVDSGTPDSGPIDAGLLDAGAMDAGAVDAGTPDSGRSDVVLPTDSGTAFGVTFDGENVWSVVRTSAAGTAVFRDTLAVYTSLSAPVAMYGNEEVGRGVLLAHATQLVMVADGGVPPTLTSPPRLVSLFNQGSRPLASVWSSGSANNNYNQRVFDVPSFGNPQNLPTSICAALVFHDVEVLPATLGGSGVLTYAASGCPNVDLSVGMPDGDAGVQLITPTGTRTGFVAGQHSGRTMVGRTTVGFDLASQQALTSTISHHSPDGGSLGPNDIISASDVLELGDTMFGYVLVVAQGTVQRNALQVGPFAMRTALLVPLDSQQPVIELGPAATSGRLGLWAGPTLVAALWDDASGNVRLTRINR